MSAEILVIPGDGIGPEVMSATLRVVDWLATHRNLDLNLTHAIAGGASLDKHGIPLTEDVLDQARAANAVFFGSVGGPAWSSVPFDLQPEKGLLTLRKELDLFANLRPARVLPSLASTSSLKIEHVEGLDLIILRENTGGVYFAEPRGIETEPDGTRSAHDTNRYTTAEIERVGRVGIELARQRTGKLTSVEKANVMWSGVLWREVITELCQREADGVQLEHMYADNCAMQLVREPRQFDVIVTDNLFGDLLSDCAAMLTGSLGMLPSASLGDLDGSDSQRQGLYEPVHGSAPDIAGKGIANPLAQVLSFAMLLRYSLNKPADADTLESAVDSVLANGIRTPDIAAPGQTAAGTEAVIDALLNTLQETHD